jgi:hypothetical protein
VSPTIFPGAEWSGSEQGWVDAARMNITRRARHEFICCMEDAKQGADSTAAYRLAAPRTVVQER